MELNSEKQLSIAGNRKKTRKAVRLGGIGESNIGIGNTSISRPSLLGMEKQKHDDSNLSSMFSKRPTSLKFERNYEPTNENKALGQGLNLSLTGFSNKNKEIDGKSSMLKKNFKEDIKEEVELVTAENAEIQDELNSTANCPFLVGSGSEASYERSSEVQTILRKNRNDSRVDYGSIHNEDPISLKDLVLTLNNGSLGILGISQDVEGLSKWFSKMVNKFESFGLNIQGKLEKLEQDLEANMKEMNNYCDESDDSGAGISTNQQEDENISRNKSMKISERYLELIILKNKLLEELSNLENEIIIEEMRIKKEESERKIRIEEFKSTRRTYKDELSSLTTIICWIEECLQKFVYPIQKIQSEHKMEVSRESEILKLIQEEMSKIEKQEKIILDKLREIQEVKRYKGEEKELLEEQIRLSQASKSEKIMSANFKEASMISQTIQVLQQEVAELEDSYSSVLHQEKEFMEKIERIRKCYQDESSRMDACKHDILINRKRRRHELKQKIQRLKECKFLINNDMASEGTKLILNSLSENFYNHIDSVLSFEMSIINQHDLEDEKEYGIDDLKTQKNQIKSTETSIPLKNYQDQTTINSESGPKSDDYSQEKTPQVAYIECNKDQNQDQPIKTQSNECISTKMFKELNISDSESSIDNKSEHDDFVDSVSPKIAIKADSNVDQSTEL